MPRIVVAFGEGPFHEEVVGYTVFGELLDFPAGHSKRFLTKRL